MLVAPGWAGAQEGLVFSITLEAHDIGINPTAPTDTGIFVPAGAEISIAFGATDMPWGESPAPFTLHAYLEGQEDAAIPVIDAAPIRFDNDGQLRLVPANVACAAAADWGAAAAEVSARYDHIVTAQDGDRAGAWGPSIVRLAATDAMTITAAGAVAFWEGAAPFGLEGQGKLLGDTLAPDLAANSLIGVIGDNAPFLIGTGTGGRGEAGWLRISVNDQIDKPGAYRNNSGTVSLTVDVTRAAGEAGALAAACSDDEPAPTSGQRQGAAAAVLELPIAPGQILVTDAEYRTADHALGLVFRETGELVVQRPDGHTIWSSLDAGAPVVPGGSVMVSFGGELALFDAQRQLVWAPVGDMAVPGSILYIDDDQILKMLSPSWTVTWPRDPVQVGAPAVIPVAPAVLQPATAAPITPKPPAAPPAALVPANPDRPPAVPAPVVEVPVAQPVEDIAQDPGAPDTPAPTPVPVVETPVEQPGADMAEDPGVVPAPEPNPGGEVETTPSTILTTMWRQGAGECLTIGQGRHGLTPGAPVGMAPCTVSAEQRWIIIPLSDGYSYIANTAGGSALCLTSGDGSTVEPRALAITAQPCAEIPAQIWQILPQENGYYRLGAMTFSNVMCLEGGSPDADPLDGAAFMDMCQDVSGQYWTDSLGGQ